MIGFLLIFSLVFLIFGFRKNASLKEELGVKTKELEKFKEAKKKLEQLQKESEQQRLDLKEINEMVPENEREPLQLMKKLTSLAAQRKIRNIGFRYQEGPRRKRSSGAPLQLGQLFILMDFECEFSSLISFLSDILELKRIVSIDSIIIERVEEILPRQEIRLRLITYTFLTP
jgi:Tfp pilus assembly protein PilO